MSDSPLDVRLLAREQIPEGAFPGTAGEDLRVYLAPAPHEQAWQHARRDRSVEVCGVLVGEWKRDAAGPFVEVQHIIECKVARSGPAEVTFTHDTWAAINLEMDHRFQSLRIVGWYHTHPDFGIFLSDYDVFIHRHFFAGAGQIAWVIDPIRDQEGVFRWRDNRPQLTPQFWMGNSIRPAPPPPGAALSAWASGSQTPGAVPSPVPEPRGWAGPGWSTPWGGVALLCVGGILGQMFAAWTDSQRALNQRTALTIEFFQNRLLRLGLEKVTQSARQDLKELAAGLRHMEAQAREPGQTTPEQVRGELESMRRHVNQLQAKIQLIDRRYALSTREQEQLARLLLTEVPERAASHAGRPVEEDKPRSPEDKGASGKGAAESATLQPAGSISAPSLETKSPSPVPTDRSQTD